MVFSIRLLVGFSYLLQGLIVKASPTQLHNNVRSEIHDTEARLPVQESHEKRAFWAATAPKGANITECPPCGFIGYGLDLTGADPFDIEKLADSVQRSHRIYKFSTDRADFHVPGTTGETWWTLSTDLMPDTTGDEAFHDWTYGRDGAETASKLEVGGRLQGEYSSIKGSIDISYATRSQFETSRMYALYTYDDTTLKVSLDNPDGTSKFLATDQLKNYITSIGLPEWDGADDRVVEVYQLLFEELGTHIITQVNYGSRLQLKADALNSNKASVTHWQADVDAAFSGLAMPAKAEIDANITSSDHYNVMKQSLHRDVHVRGGDHVLATQIKVDPSAEGVNDTFTKWLDSAEQRPDYTGFVVKSLYTVFSEADDPDVVKLWPSIKAGYQYLVDNPKFYDTVVSLIVTADWARFELYSPGSFIKSGSIKVPSGHPLESQTYTGFIFHAPGDTISDGERIDFTIRSNGEPLTVALSHGSSGPGRTTGKVELMNTADPNNPLVNDKITENQFNTMTFTNVKTNDRPSPDKANPLYDSAGIGRKTMSQDCPQIDANRAETGVGVNELGLLCPVQAAEPGLTMPEQAAEPGVESVQTF